jgi:hypothetical protein
MPSEANMETVTAFDNEGEGRVRADLRLAMRAIRMKCDVPPVVLQAIVGRATRVLQNPEAKARDVARASQTLLAAQRLGFDAIKEEDRMARLDAGMPTENVAVMDMADSALEAVARSIAAVAADTPVLKPCRKPKTKPNRKP